MFFNEKNLINKVILMDSSKKKKKKKKKKKRRMCIYNKINK